MPRMIPSNEREALKALNPDPKWQQKIAAMKPADLKAVYQRLKAQGKV